MIPPGEWFFLAVTLSGGDAEKGELRVTVNDTVIRLPSQMVDSRLDGLIDMLGREMNDCVLDEVTVFQRALSEAEIASIRRSGVEGKPLVKSADGFVPLFNGKDLSGWKPHEKHANN